VAGLVLAAAACLGSGEAQAQGRRVYGYRAKNKHNKKKFIKNNNFF
jgi:hypothetical protein